MSRWADHNLRKREVSRAIIAEATADGCSRCGERDRRTLSFHHVDPADKLFTIGRTLHVQAQRLRDEIAKCVVLCANCHLIVEDELRQEREDCKPVDDDQLALL